jgi:hypothetical protein
MTEVIVKVAGRLNRVNPQVMDRNQQAVVAMGFEPVGVHIWKADDASHRPNAFCWTYNTFWAQYAYSPDEPGTRILLFCCMEKHCFVVGLKHDALFVTLSPELSCTRFSVPITVVKNAATLWLLNPTLIVRV